MLVADSYCETLPIDGPPSFRGQSVKYVYKLTIGCQRVNSPIKLLRVPFRVLVLHGKATRCPALGHGLQPAPLTLTFSPGLKDYQCPQDEAVAPSNPFLEEEEGLKKDSRLADLATDLLMAATSRRSLRRSLPLGEPAAPTRARSRQCLQACPLPRAALAAKIPLLAQQGSVCGCGAAPSGPARIRVSHRLPHASVVCCCSLLTFPEGNAASRACPSFPSSQVVSDGLLG